MRTPVLIMALCLLLAACDSDTEHTASGQDPDASVKAASMQEKPDSKSSTHAAPVAREMIQLEPGMRWSYRVEGEMRGPERPPMPLTGSIDIAIEEGELDGEPVLALRFDQDIRPDIEAMPAPPPGAPTGSPGEEQHSIFGGQAPPAAVFYFRQDSETGAVNFVGDNNGPDGAGRKALGEGGLFIPGQWSADTRYENTIEWEGGDTTWNWLEVDGTEVIETGVGAYTAWRAPNRSSDSNGLKVEGTDWWAPQLGQPAKFESITALPDGGEVHVVAVLESTNQVE